MMVAIALLLTIGTLAFVFVPIFVPCRQDLQVVLPLDAKEDEKKALIAAIRDLDYDYQIGNMVEREYKDLRTSYKRRVAVLYKQSAKQQQELEAAIEEQVQALRHNTSKR